MKVANSRHMYVKGKLEDFQVNHSNELTQINYSNDLAQIKKKDGTSLFFDITHEVFIDEHVVERIAENNIRWYGNLLNISLFPETYFKQAHDLAQSMIDLGLESPYDLQSMVNIANIGMENPERARELWAWMKE